MGEAEEVQLHVTDDDEEKETNSVAQINSNTNQLYPTEPQRRNYKWWLKLALYTVFVLAGQASATLLGRLYYSNGGQSKWIGALVQVVGFPLLIPYYFLSIFPKNSTINGDHLHPKRPRIIVLASVYVILGLLIAGVCFLSSLGLLYLPVSTYTLIGASQLSFTFVFSFFLNSQKFTPFIVNSVIVLTISSVLLVFHSNDADSGTRVSKGKYAVGFLCTIGASAGSGLLLAVTQFVFRRVIKVGMARAVIELMIGQSLVASCFSVVGLFASGEWKGINRETEEFELGKVSYAMTLVWTVICCEVSAIGSVGLIFEVSSLFCNVITTLVLPLAQVLAVLTLHDKMDGLKVVSLLLAIWGFISCIYQHYLDDYHKSETDQSAEPNERSFQRFPVERG